MLGRTHNVIGVSTAVGVGIAAQRGWVVTGGLAVAAYAGSRLPDKLEGGILSHRGPTHRLWMGLVVGAAVAYGVTRLWHWKWFVDNVLAGPRAVGLHTDALLHVGTAVAIVVGAGVALGYIMHLLADMCTIHGLDVSGRRVHLLPHGLRIRTGGAPEHLLRTLILFAWVAVPALVLFGCGAAKTCADRDAGVWASANAHQQGLPDGLNTTVRPGTTWPRLVLLHGVSDTHSVSVHVGCSKGEYTFVGPPSFYLAR